MIMPKQNRCPMYLLGLVRQRAEVERDVCEQRLREKKEIVKNLLELHGGGCRYLIRKAGSGKPNMNGGYPSAICATCGKNFCCQCLISVVFNKHKAICTG